MSVAGGLENAFVAATTAGSDCLQIFVKNQRQWKAPPLSDEQIARYRLAEADSAIAPVIAHASYLINLASPIAASRDKGADALVDELERCETLGVTGLVLHPGAHMEDTLSAGIARIADSLDRIHSRTAGLRCMILLETTAGQGTAIGHRFEHISHIVGLAKEPDRLGVCLDTCHLFAAGYDFRTAAGYAAMMDEMQATIGVDAVQCIHTNDSKRELGSRVDRHEHIGKGKIGKAGFTHFVKDPRWCGMPMILETPKGKDGRGADLDKVNIKRLRSLLSS